MLHHIRDTPAPSSTRAVAVSFYPNASGVLSVGSDGRAGGRRAVGLREHAGALFVGLDPIRAFQMEFADLPTSLVGQIINHLAYPLFFVQRHARHRYRFFFSKACSTSRRMASGREGRSSWWALQASSFSSRS